VKIDLKVFDRLMDSELLVSNEGARGFDSGQFAMEWIAATYGLDGITAFMEHLDFMYQSITSQPDYP